MVRSPGDLRQPLANALQHDYGFIIMKGHHSLSSQDVMLYFMQLVEQLERFTTQEVGLFVRLQGYLVDYKLTDQHGTPLDLRHCLDLVSRLTHRPIILFISTRTWNQQDTSDGLEGKTMQAWESSKSTIQKSIRLQSRTLRSMIWTWPWSTTTSKTLAVLSSVKSFR